MLGMVAMIIGAIVAAIGGILYGLYKAYRWAADKWGWPVPGFVLRWEEKRRLAKEQAEEEARIAAEQALIDAEEAKRLEAVANLPFTWEGDVQWPPAIPELDPVEKTGDVTQEHIDAYASTTREFWVGLQDSMQAPYSAYAAHKALSLRGFANICKGAPDIQQALGVLNQYVVLKGEFLVGSSGPHLVTNYRLQLFVDNVRHNIPLSNLQAYSLSMGPLQMKWTEDGQPRELSITGSVLADGMVNSARSAKAWQNLGPTQELLLGQTQFDLGQASPGLDIPEIELLDPAEGAADEAPTEAPSEEVAPEESSAD